jgi:hypothetical protein
MSDATEKSFGWSDVLTFGRRAAVPKSTAKRKPVPRRRRKKIDWKMCVTMACAVTLGVLSALEMWHNNHQGMQNGQEQKIRANGQETVVTQEEIDQAEKDRRDAGDGNHDH